MDSSSRATAYIITFAGIIILPLIWFVVADCLELTSPLLLPTLSSVVDRLIQLLVSGSLLVDLQYSLWRWALGFSAGMILGIICGLILGYSLVVRKLFEFPIEVFRSLPVTAIFPLYLLIFGIGDAAKIAMAFTPTFLYMLVNTSYGVILAEPARRKMARVFGASWWQIFFYIVTYDALPQIFVGLRLSVSLSLLVTVVSEMFIGTDFGIGQRIYDSYLTNSVTTLYALLIVLGILGYVVNASLVGIQKKVLFWAER